MIVFSELLAAITPTPSPAPTVPAFTGDADLVTPTWVGFAFTFVIAAAVIALVLDMVRRIRRVSYRADIRQRLEEEAEASGATEPSEAVAPSEAAESTGDEPRRPADR